MSDASGPPAAVEASLDVVVDGTLMGWARDPGRPDGTALLQLRLGRQRVALFCADLLRPDLREAGFGTGHHGFAVPVPPEVWAQARRTGEALTASSPADPGRTLFAVDDAERLDAPGWLRPMLAEALAADAAPPALAAAPAGTGAGRPPYAPLFAPIAPAAAGGPGLFAYAEHVRHLRGVAGRFAPALIGPDLDHFFRWYLADYAAARAPLRAPLAAATIRWLNEPVTVGGLRHAPTRAMLWFMAEAGRALGALADDASHLDLAYWWACERAPELGVEDCLVPRPLADALCRPAEHWAGRAFPLSAFMERALLRRPALSRLGPMHSLSARVTAYLLLLAEAREEPGLLRFVPRPVLDRMLRGDAPLFDRLAADLAGTDPAVRPLDVRGFRADLARRGFDLDALGFLSVDADGDRCEAARFAGGAVRPAAPAPAARVDVQVVGPFGKASGVGRAARLSRAALDATGLSVAAFDCDFDNRQPGEVDGRGGGPVPARVNLIHLNADMLPSAYAYLPGFDRDTYAIGFFFWELDRPAECHRLALDLVDEVWVASDYNRRCFAAWTDKPVVDVGAGLEVGPAPSREAADAARRELGRAAAGDFVVLATFDALSSVSRKNPLGLLRAFRDAFPGDPAARLVLKTHNTAAAGEGFARRAWDEVLRVAAADARVVVIDETLPFDAVMALTAGADCYASLHRSEGLGLGILEAMRLGVPVMCTAYGGSLDFCDAETAWLVEADEVAVGEAEYPYASPGHRWAEPRHASAVEALRGLRAQPALREARAAAARARVAERHSTEAAAARYAARLRAILGDRPAGDPPRADPPAGDARRPRRFAWPRGG